MQEELQTRVTKLDISIEAIAEANRNLDSKFQSLDGYLHATQMLARDERITRLENITGELSKQILDSISCLESFMMHEIKASHEDVLARLEDKFEQEGTDSIRSETPTPRRYVNHPKAVTHTPLVYLPWWWTSNHVKNTPRGRQHIHGNQS